MNKNLGHINKLFNDYYKLKKDYENKKNGKQNKGKNCVICNKAGGTFFSNKDRIFHAYCQSVEKCFEIKFHMRCNNINIKDDLLDKKKIVDKYAEKIIQLKMNVMYKYINEKTSKDLFLKGIESFMKKNDIYLLQLQKYNDIYNNEVRIKAIVDKKILIETEKNKLLEMIDDVPINEIVTQQIIIGKLCKELSALIYDIMEMRIIMTTSKLFQKDISNNIIEECTFSVEKEYYKNFNQEEEKEEELEKNKEDNNKEEEEKKDEEDEQEEWEEQKEEEQNEEQEEEEQNEEQEDEEEENDFKNYQDYHNRRKELKLQILDKNSSLNDSGLTCVIIPHRNNIEKLKKLLKLFKNTKYDVVVIDQNNADELNKGLLSNIGFFIAKTKKNYSRYLFHDVNIFPTTSLVEEYQENMDYNIKFANSDIIGFTEIDFEKINGFPNLFFGLDGQNESLDNRCIRNKVQFFKSNNYMTTKPLTRKKINENEIFRDLTEWKYNGVKQIDNFFINYKNYENMIEFEKSFVNGKDSNENNSKLLAEFTSNNNNNIDFYKIDYLSSHSIDNNDIKDKSFAKINADNRIEKFKSENDNYFQHKTNPLFISSIEPLIYWNEIEKNILDTYTEPKQFENNIVGNEINDSLLNEQFLNYKKNLTKDDLEKTLKFVFDHYAELIYIRIRNNKIECSYHIYNKDISIDWYKDLKYKGKNLDSSVIELMNDRKKEYLTLKKPHFLVANNCLLNFEAYTYFEGNPTSYVKEFIEMINLTIEKHKIIPDCDLLLNRRDFAFLRKDNRSAYEHLNDDIITNIDKYWMIGSQSRKDIHLDIAIPSADEWQSLSEKEMIDIEWEKRKSTALFRGRSTGCNKTLDNPRLKLADISFKWSKDKNKSRNKLIDVKISNLVSRITAYDKIIQSSNIKNFNYLKGNRIEKNEQMNYKYIFNIEGNAQAYRYPSEFQKGSVILSVKSDYKMWFEPLIKNNKHYIEIDPDYKNLENKMKWLIEHDKEAKDIAQHGKEFYNNSLNKDSIIDYWFSFMYHVNKYSS
jgi:hypothetical protein